MKGKILFLIIVLIHLVPLAGCAPSQSDLAGPNDDCTDELAALMKSRPESSHLTTLDGQQVLLGDFYRLNWNAPPLCALPEKFHHWKREIKWVRARTAGRIISHQVRIYHNTCPPAAPTGPTPARPRATWLNSTMNTGCSWDWPSTQAKACSALFPTLVTAGQAM